MIVNQSAEPAGAVWTLADRAERKDRCAPLLGGTKLLALNGPSHLFSEFTVSPTSRQV